MRKALALASMTSAGQSLRRPALLLPVPLLTLAAFWAGHHLWVVLGVIAAQVAWLVLSLRQAAPAAAAAIRHGYPRMTDVETVEHLLPNGEDEDGAGPRGAALVIRVDDAGSVSSKHGTRYAEALMHELGRRLGQTLREQDAYCRLGPAGFGIALFPQRNLELSAVLAVAQRIQSHLGQTFSFESVAVWPSLSVGFCLSPRAARLNGTGMLDAVA